ncbi:hypothetical protein TNIN_413581 [Trichonephila inaurata madagascariensis]|uniref:Uncharacterized protein n=1 Tax=Trichonephila inaurata madagascariensis TaxID=2747483 RepID=A0A8X6YEN8_9ARAC|nr:hypothetical protein TNIN_413581 [Trichonephila inaurata madagascariensis]
MPHSDFIGPLASKTKNYNQLFTVVEALTKFGCSSKDYITLRCIAEAEITSRLQKLFVILLKLSTKWYKFLTYGHTIVESKQNPWAEVQKNTSFELLTDSKERKSRGHESS